MSWWQITLICIAFSLFWLVLSAVLYKQFFKRFYDIFLSGLAIIVLSPIFIILSIIGSIKMKGNPFFTQLRPGKINKKTGKERIFKLIKFRTMTCEKDENGNLLPDEKRLTKYGRILRATSLDELPELLNIFIGQMSIIGPRPLLVEYLPYYTVEEKSRHFIRPGLTGLAQVNGRNALKWNDRLHFDVEYVNKITIFTDIKIIFLTIRKVIKKDGISEDTARSEGNLAKIRKEENCSFENLKG